MSDAAVRNDLRYAPGAPGIAPRWTSSAKAGIGTALNLHSRVWFTLSHGILNEIYFPRVDHACTRDLGLIVTDGRQFFSEEKRHCTFEIVPIEPGVPAYELTNTHMEGRYRIEKEVLTDPWRNVVLQKVRFVPLQGKLGDYRLYALLASHLANMGYGNTAWVGDYKGKPMLFAQRDPSALALACSAPWLKRSVGFAGTSDGWQDLSRNFQMTWEYDRAENGNVALTAEIDLAACNGEFILALGFGALWAEAGQQTLSSLLNAYEMTRKDYIFHWQHWQKTLKKLDDKPRAKDLYRASAVVLRTHESKDFIGGIIASLSIPWGFNKGDEDLGGYHLIWPRDLVESAGGLLAAGADDDALRVLHYLEATQEADGHWAQNMWLDGRPYWNGLQMDETAFPILLVDLLRRESPRCFQQTDRWWPMVRKAAAFIVANGPVTPQDRWEEDGGYSPFTLAAEISALLIAADFAQSMGKAEPAEFLRQMADTWNDNVERWTYAVNSDLARQVGVEGYYVRVSPADGDGAASPLQGFVAIKNRATSPDAPAVEIVSPDALALVRFGLRAPDDPRMLNTIKVIDGLLRVKLPQGPGWYRYTRDGYGEHEDGSPFDGTGVGRPWPLLAGERAHYELAAGRAASAEALLGVMENSTGASRLIPEQVWDKTDIPERELFAGKGSGSACPLVWAHSEYIKLRRSLIDGKVFDQPPQTVERYLTKKKSAEYFNWRFNNKPRTMPCGKKLRLLLIEPAMVHWSFDNWQTAHDSDSEESGWNLQHVDLPTETLRASRQITFTFFWKNGARWEGRDYQVIVE
ncbi:MAG TPA: glucan 1,4-alpha-glucosidase [Terriglobales bacterium]|nr:glucan 1,4-alpha-glucosidase [Terriglobales bacterium]